MKIKAKKPELANNSNSIYFAKKDEENIDFKLNWLYLTVTFWPKTDDNDRDCGKKYKYFSSTAHICLSTINTCCLFPNVGLLSFCLQIWFETQRKPTEILCPVLRSQTNLLKPAWLSTAHRKFPDFTATQTSHSRSLKVHHRRGKKEKINTGLKRLFSWIPQNPES